MKKTLFTYSGILWTCAVMAQLPVSTSPQNKKVVLEEFTGIKCGYCPDGHVKANTIYNADPNNVILVNIHSGSFANANTGEVDFKTTDGTAIDAMPGMLIAGYPAGTVNRTVWSSSQTSGGMAQSRGSWASSANTVKSQSAYCNVALQGTVDVTTRMLSVEAQVYYTANSPVASNSITIMLLENDIVSAQSNYGLPYYNLPNYMPDGKYYHNHVLRKVLTPTFGQTIPLTTSGTTFSTTLNYSIPLTFGAAGKTSNCDLANIELVAFVTETNVKTINAAHGPIFYAGLANTLDISVGDLEVESSVCSGIINPEFSFTNQGSTAINSAVFSYAVNGSAATNYSWTGSAVDALDKSPMISLPGIAFTPSTNNTLTINVLSVNGTTDQNNANNNLTKNIPLTTKTPTNVNMNMNFVQDRWGSEVKWTVYEEANNTIVETDGPWSNLTSNATLSHPKSFTVVPNTCYMLVVEDTGGNGINLFHGAGGYTLNSGTSALFTSNGKFGYGEVLFFQAKNANLVGLGENVSGINAVRIYPNPSLGQTELLVNLQHNGQVQINVTNSMGQEIYHIENLDLSEGKNTLELNTQSWESGIYFVNVLTPTGKMTQKFSVSK